MCRIHYIVLMFLLSIYTPTHVIAKTTTENKNHQHNSEPRKPKPSLAIGVTYDKDGKLWLAKVKNQKLLVSHSYDNGKNFSAPVVVTPETESIYADGENRPKIVVAQDGTILLTWAQKLSKKYSGDIRFARSTDSGQTFSSPITLNDDGLITTHRFDSLTINDKGRVVIAWLDARDEMQQEIKTKNLPEFQSIPRSQLITVQTLISIKNFTNMFASAAECILSGRQMVR